MKITQQMITGILQRFNNRHICFATKII